MPIIETFSLCYSEVAVEVDAFHSLIFQILKFKNNVSLNVLYPPLMWALGCKKVVRDVAQKEYHTNKNLYRRIPLIFNLLPNIIFLPSPNK